MGADLYIENIHQPVYQKYKPLFLAAMRKRDQYAEGSKEAEAAQADVEKYVELMFSAGYFRDNYNASSVLWRLGLSWWEDVIPLCDAAHNLKGTALMNFRDTIRTAKLKLPTKAELHADGLQRTPLGGLGLAQWHGYFRHRHKELLAFLDEAITRNTSIYCWL